MTHHRKFQQAAALALIIIATTTGAATAQQSNDPTCAETLTEQLRRFSEKCISDLVSFVSSQADMTAKIYSEKEKYYIILTRTDDGMLAEAVSKFNYPLMKADTPDILKRLGWEAPENESDNWKKRVSSDIIRSGNAAREVSEALSAYGLKQGEAISLTVGPKLSDKPTNG
jgi:alpha-mannosidase